MRRAIIAFFAAAFFAASPAWAQTSASPAPPPENVAAARQLIQVMRATDQFKAILPTIIQGLRPAVVQGRPEMEKDFDTIMPIIINGATQHLNELADKLADVYASNFSVDEIHDLIAFYQTPTGQKLLDRQSVVARESMAAGQHFGQALVMELKEQITDELRKRGRAN
jgi:hypothetical protein